MHPTRRAFITRTAALVGLPVILPSRAGKGIYCEQPCTVAGSQEIDAELKLAAPIYQGGMQRRDVDDFQVAVDPAKESFIDDAEADALRSRSRREPFTVRRRWTCGLVPAT